MAGTAFAALEVADVAATSTWLADALGLQQLITHDDICAVGEQFTYLIDPESLTIIGIHQQAASRPGAAVGIDHLALRVPTIGWHAAGETSGHHPTPIAPWKFGTFTEITGPQGLKIRLFVPALR